jgi:hypothetical protein
MQISSLGCEKKQYIFDLLKAKRDLSPIDHSRIKYRWRTLHVFLLVKSTMRWTTGVSRQELQGTAA